MTGDTATIVRMIERLLWLQILIAVIATLPAGWAAIDGTGSAVVPLLFLAEAALIGAALQGFKRGMAFAPYLYGAVVVVIFVEAVTMAGLASIVFKAEAVLSLVACYYVFALRGRSRASG
ncbi:MAG: hypothetical protein ACFBWO_18755 [Paracoccaceae bacterium]